MYLTENFLRKVQPFASPRMGTEVMAPLLYNMVRFTRPKTCLEIGMGYTSLFIAKALADNYADYMKGREGMLKAAEAFDVEPGKSVRDAFSKADKSARLAYLESYPYLSDPAFYEDTDPTPGRLVAIDDMSSGETSANVISAALTSLDLDAHVDVVTGDFRGLSDKVKSQFGAIDFIWFDCGGMCEYRDFLEEYWALLNPDGGLLVMHYTLTNTSMGYVRQNLEKKLADGTLPGAEILSLREPHKMMQNSFTMVKRTDGFKDEIYTEVRDISLERDT